MNLGLHPISRRKAVAGIAAVLGGLAAQAQQPMMQEKQSSAANARRTSLHQEIALPAPPQRIFHALLDSEEFAAFSGMPAEIDSRPGGVFHMFNRMIEAATSRSSRLGASFRHGGRLHGRAAFIPSCTSS